MHRPNVGAEWSSETTTARPLGSFFMAVGAFHSCACGTSANPDRAMTDKKRIRGFMKGFLSCFLDVSGAVLTILKTTLRELCWPRAGEAWTIPFRMPSPRSPLAPLLQVEDLNVSFATERGEVRAVREVSFRIDESATLGLVGESGSGKSATALAILRLLPPEARVNGKINFAGHDLLGLDGEAMR